MTLFVGDGFKFLSENHDTYDVIITDSSDPNGPACVLFEKPYFQLLHDALKPGGNISTQGECLWLHLPLITSIQKMTREIFPTVDFAYTTIPTYPSGQIGFTLCSKDPNRNFKVPLRKVSPTKYYNDKVHKASFVLPEFARSVLKEGKDIQPLYGRAAKAAAVKKTQKVLLLCNRYDALPCAEYIVSDPANILTVGERCHIFLSFLCLTYPSLPNASGSRSTRLRASQGHGDFP